MTRLMASIHHNFVRKQVGGTEKRTHSEIQRDCTDRRDPGPAAGLEVFPTSDTCQLVANFDEQMPFSSLPNTSWGGGGG